MKKKRRTQNQQNLGPILLMGLGLLLLLVMALLLLSRNTGNQQGANPGGAAATPANVERVSLADAKAAFDSGEAVFLDVRDPGSFGQDHIPGAVNIPLAQLENRLSELDPNQWIITYCT